MSLWERIARDTVGDDYAAAYARRFRAMANRGEDPHGEAGLVNTLLPPPARVLDAGCGTGRIATHLHGQGYDVVGVDVDAAMLGEARASAPDLEWREADLTTLGLGRHFDLVLLAGNVIPLLEPETLRTVAQRLADHVGPGGAVVCGFGLDDEHLPGDCPVTPLASVDAAFADAGLEAGARWSSWDQDPFPDDSGSGYVVTLHRWVP
ncbi:trans-aconitate 2-methyltransferase [Nocardioides sp.]|uniref:class I SAM-dependent methyltransferase n=1 Tax=Nocardioides sp. TaxID=35761 RepID=UPI002734D3BB|nr:class I SAM-dependent methyltransferase [Nocardioides sp.]MDP3893164.1 class I SAM-dependent methyltransferase [Nocardioides sp.]